MLFYLFITIFTFLFMEFVAWFTHKFIMHGFLWYLHKDHHQVEPGFFEKNDTFFLIFAIPSSLSYIFGLATPNYALLAVGIGISLYGLCYFLVHDVIIHQRFKWFTHWNNRYVIAIRRAHKIHHKNLHKHKGENFGMLIVPIKYWLNPHLSK